MIEINDTTLEHLFPLPFRIASLLTLGIWYWGINLQGLSLAHIDIYSCLKYSSPQSSITQGVFKLAKQASLGLLACFVLYAIQPIDSVVTPLMKWASLCVILALLFSSHSQGKLFFTSVILRCIQGSIDVENRLPDILAADAMTSYAKVFADIGVAFTSIDDDHLDRSGILVPILTSIPFIIRLSQCWIDYKNTNNNLHLMNLGKYASSIPMNLCAAAVKNQWGMIPHSASLWIFWSLINSTYSFIWDIRCDWGLTDRHLRPVLYFQNKKVYYTAGIADFFLRYVWILKVWYDIPSTEMQVFTLQFLEITRRFMWVFFRVEYEYVANPHLQKSIPLTVIDE